MTQILHKCLPITYPIIPLIGPTHAEEVAKKIPSAIVAGSRKKKYTTFIQNALTTPTFRIYTNTDTVGVEYASTLKNIIAIAAGMADGVGFGDNTKAALITRGLAEMVRFGKKFGANERTFYGLAGVGDLITTCNSPYGRNLKLGRLIAEGLTLDGAVKKIGQVCEGIKATSVVYKLSQKRKIDMPIVQETYNVLFENKKPLDATKSLMERQVKDETWGHA
jgi:glycerol-3-phosphate dehydrogenase (NAD(P)+)